MDRLKGFQPYGNPFLGIVVLPTEILEPIVQHVKPNVEENLYTPTLEIGILDIMGLEPPLIMNGELKVIDVEVVILDVPSGGIPLRFF